MRNLALLTDSYKVSHWRQYPEGTEHVYSYFESRGGRFDQIRWFGLQYFLKEYLTERIVHSDITEAREFWAAHFGDPTVFNHFGWQKLLQDHRGLLPLRIRAVPEGTLVPPLNVLMTVENTDPNFPWLTNWFETLLSQVWYPATVASYSYAIKQLIQRRLERTGDPAGLPFKLHDFGFRGVSSVESAGIGGLAHLTNFMGTDTAEALLFGRKYYGEPMAGFSIPAAEHSTITSYGGPEHEVNAFRRMINEFGTGGAGLYAVVSDSYDIFHACRNLWGGVLKDAVLAAPNTLVVRPDSGVPHLIVPDVIEELGKAFGFTTNAKGYRVLNKVRVIQGDGIDLEEIRKILDQMEVVKQSADNVAFGCGGGLLQKHNRDTCKFAFKCSHVSGTYGERDVYKDPVTDQGKASKRGRLRLVRDSNGRFMTLPAEFGGEDELITVYENGHLQVDQTLADVRAREVAVTV